VFWAKTIPDAVLTAAGEKEGTVAFRVVAAGDCRMAAEEQVGFRIF
jgi:hypothetical protein